MPILIRGGGLHHRHAGAFLAALLFCAPASANPDLENFRDFLDARENNGSITGVTGCQPASFEAACRGTAVSTGANANPGWQGANAGDPVTTGINANLGWRVGMLAGQPLVEMAINWTPKSLEGMLPAGYAKADPGLVAGLDPAANAKLDLYDVHIAIAFEHEGRTYTITDTVGVPARAGNESSFNVAGSYDWGRFIRDRNGNLVDGETAKAIVKAGVKPIGAAIVQAKVNTFDLQTYWHDKNVDRYNAPLREAVESQLLLLDDTFGLPVDEIRVALANYEAEHSPQEVNRKLVSMFERLTPANLPEKYLGTGLARDIKLRIYANAVGGIDGRLRNQMQELPPQPGGGASATRAGSSKQKPCSGRANCGLHSFATTGARHSGSNTRSRRKSAARQSAARKNAPRKNARRPGKPNAATRSARGARRKRGRATGMSIVPMAKATAAGTALPRASTKWCSRPMADTTPMLMPIRVETTSVVAPARPINHLGMCSNIPVR